MRSPFAPGAGGWRNRRGARCGEEFRGRCCQWRGPTPPTEPRSEGGPLSRTSCPPRASEGENPCGGDRVGDDRGSGSDKPCALSRLVQLDKWQRIPGSLRHQVERGLLSGEGRRCANV